MDTLDPLGIKGENSKDANFQLEKDGKKQENIYGMNSQNIGDMVVDESMIELIPHDFRPNIRPDNDSEFRRLDIHLHPSHPSDSPVTCSSIHPNPIHSPPADEAGGKRVKRVIGVWLSRVGVKPVQDRTGPAWTEDRIRGGRWTEDRTGPVSTRTEPDRTGPGRGLTYRPGSEMARAARACWHARANKFFSQFSGTALRTAVPHMLILNI